MYYITRSYIVVSKPRLYIVVLQFRMSTKNFSLAKKGTNFVESPWGSRSLFWSFQVNFQTILKLGVEWLRHGPLGLNTLGGFNLVKNTLGQKKIFFSKNRIFPLGFFRRFANYGSKLSTINFGFYFRGWATSWKF